MVTSKIKEKRTEKKPLLPQVMCGMALSFMMLIFAPVEMVATNGTNFWFGISDFLPMFMILAVAVFAAVEVVYLLLRKLPYAVWLLMVALLFGMVLGLYVQGTYLCLSYEALTSGDPVWRNMLPEMLINTVAWAVVIVGSLVLCVLNTRLFLKAVPAVCALIMVMQGTAMTVLMIQSTQQSDLNLYYCSSKDQRTFSQNGDVIVVMLDTFDTRLMDRAINEDPTETAVFDDFTYYRNNSSSTRLTYTSVVSMLTGEVYRNEEPFFLYCRRTMRENAFFKALRDSGMTVNLYGMPDGVLGEEQLNVVDNLRVRNSTISNKADFIKEMMCLVGYRYLPATMQPFVLRSFSRNFADLQNVRDEQYSEYSTSNTAFRDMLLKDDVQIDNSRRFFKFFGLHGAHKPVQFDRNMMENEQVTQYEEILGCMKMMGIFFDELRNAGIYDKATIIVLGDHGVNDDRNDGLCNPVMLVKYPGESGQMRVSNAPTALLDMRATALYGAGIEHEGIGTPAHEWEGVTQRKRTLLRYFYSVLLSYDSYMNPITEYIVPSDATNLDAYVPSGNVYEKPN